MSCSLIKVFLKEKLEIEDISVISIVTEKGSILIGEASVIMPYLTKIENNKYYIEQVYHHALMKYPIYDMPNIRIEKGAIIRENVTLSNNCIILMNATINCGAFIGENTMIDMNAVVGSGAYIGNNVHIGAGAVISGIMEPISSKKVIIEDQVFIGANAVVLNGVKIGIGAIIGAGSIVTKDVDPFTVCYGNPASYKGIVTQGVKEKVALDPNLRINNT